LFALPFNSTLRVRSCSKAEEQDEKEKDKMASVDIPKKYKAAVYDKPGSISTKIEELDVPEPGAGEVLINLYVAAMPHPLLSTLARHLTSINM
jgi:hypothetical protein